MAQPAAAAAAAAISPRAINFDGDGDRLRLRQERPITPAANLGKLREELPNEQDSFWRTKRVVGPIVDTCVSCTIT